MHVRGTGVLALFGVAAGLRVSPHSPRMMAVSAASPWEVLSKRALSTETGARLDAESSERALGRGPTHTDSLLRYVVAVVRNRDTPQMLQISNIGKTLFGT